MPPPCPKHDEMIRVDHAGEYGAGRIYAGQLAVLGNKDCAPVIREMAEQEADHLAAFEAMMRANHARPSLLMPVWHVGGWLLGAGSALLGKEAAMACTVAVESVIMEHYDEQMQKLDADETPELAQLIRRCRDEEQEHHDVGLAEEAEQAPAYPLLSSSIKKGTRLAIWLAKRF